MALGLLVALAFAVETAAGFGSMVVLLTLGGLLAPLPALMAVVVPVNLLVSAAVVLRDPAAVQVRVLARQVLPAMLLGVSLGVMVAGRASAVELQRLFGLFVVVLAAVALLVPARTGSEPPRRATLAWLTAGGVAHGVFAAGGPLVVHALARALPEKRAFRATLAALWLVLNLAVVAGQVLRAQVDAGTLLRSAALVPMAAVGLVLGELLHRRLSGAGFLRAVHALMLAGGAVLLLGPA